ncbi:MAG: chorismate mutase [Saccharofermentans sp.]|nr:chorismate mutase [Saccharofermentans sp.]
MTLDELRIEIDAADRELLAALAKRTAVARKIGEVKKLEGKPVYDKAREEKKLESLKNQAADEIKPYVEEFYNTVFDVSRKHQEKPLFAVLGQHLPHTYSPAIHNIFTSDYTYTIIEKEPEELDALFNSGAYGGFNVTIPYKREAAARCDVLEKDAEDCNSVNTVVFGKDGKTYGYNTDIFGFCFMLTSAGIDPKGKKCLVLGHGGAASAVGYGLNKMGAADIKFSDLYEEINYENVYDVCADAEVIINCTPVGMFPKVDNQVVDLSRFTKCDSFADVVYNPSRTKLLQQAKSLGMKTAGGLTMLVAQAYKSYKFFIGDNEGADKITPEAGEMIKKVVTTLENRMMNITLIGMPGCGKSTLAKEIARLTGRELIDLDEAYSEEYGESPSTTITQKGEDAFRANETKLASKYLPESGRILSTGGGIVTRDENYFWLRNNSRIIYVKRPLDVLASEDRPLTARDGVEKLYAQRKDRYEGLADITVDVAKKEDKAAFLSEAIDILRKEGFEL